MTDSNRWHAPFWTLSYLLGLLNLSRFLAGMTWHGVGSALFNLSAVASYAALYLAPVFVAVEGLCLLWRWRGAALSPRAGRALAWAIRGLAWLGAGAVQALVHLDFYVHSHWGLHVNGFVLNLVTTRGGLDSLGASDAARRSYALTLGAFFLVQGAILGLSLGSARAQAWGARLWTRRRLTGACALLLALGLGERLAYGFCRLRGLRAVPASARMIPLYQPLTFASLGRRLGLAVEEPGVRVRAGHGQLSYPLRPLETTTPTRPLNVVWLVAESLRADALRPDVMPQTWAFAQRARRYTDHYSGGNGTRMGLFSQFYGLYGYYWFPFLEEERAPILIERMRELGYEFSLRTSMNFSYPEFDRTIFAGFPRAAFHEGLVGVEKWQMDRQHIDAQVEFLRRREPARPFLMFQFFESSHARYFFPPEDAVKKPYLEDFNYAAVDLEAKRDQIYNRYLNACHHLDSQLGRIFGELEREGLLDSTIVIVTGDHGEEFFEKGRWGHNSEFHEEQIRVPFVLWVPGQPAAVVDRMTSHLDVPATLAPYLGIENDPADYSQGTSLLGATERSFTVVCDWRRVGYVDPSYKASLPLEAGGLFEQAVTDGHDEPLAEPGRFFTLRRSELAGVLAGLGRFRR